MRRRAEVDHDVRIARRQALAGADVEGHAGPAPVCDLGAQRDEGLGAAARGSTPGSSQVARHALRRRRCRRVYWPRTTCWPSVSGVQGLSERSTLSFSSRIASACALIGGSIADRAQQLQRMVLHHVAQRAGLVVEGAALLHAQVFGDA